MNGNQHNFWNIDDTIVSALTGVLPDWTITIIAGLIGIIALLAFLLPSQLATIWVERKLIGRFQVRYGPNRVGPFGLLQPIADALKILGKESITPAGSDKWVFWLAPIVIFIPALLVFAVIPFGPDLILANLDIGILYLISISSLSVIPVFMAGWSSNNKYALLGAMRSVAQMVSYEIPLVLSIVSVILLTSSLKLSDMVEYQNNNLWLFLLQPLAFLIFFISVSAELNRTPMDIVEGESEIIAGYHTEYSSFKFTMFYVAEYTNVLAASAIMSSVFFGGWLSAPIFNLLPAWLWFIVKIYFFFCVFVWTRATLPRMRADQLMGLAWKFLLPLALINILITGVEVYLELHPLLIMVINMALAVALVVGWSELIGNRAVTKGKGSREYIPVHSP